MNTLYALDADSSEPPANNRICVKQMTTLERYIRGVAGRSLAPYLTRPDSRLK